MSVFQTPGQLFDVLQFQGNSLAAFSSDELPERPRFLFENQTAKLRAFVWRQTNAEEFFAKVQQVGAANSKAILATSSSFQSGVVTYARSKGIGLIRSPDPKTLHWELRRSPSASTTASSPRYSIEAALTAPEDVGGPFDLYFLTKARPTNSLWEFFLDLLTDGTVSDDVVLSVLNNHRRPASSTVAFLEKTDLETRALQVLKRIGYERGMVDLNAICAHEQKISGLTVLRPPIQSDLSMRRAVLGSITFQPPAIELFNQPTPHLGRERFTLAHELAHWFLDHRIYLVREFCEQTDIDSQSISGVADSDIDRLEFQANFFASCLLMPRQTILEVFLDTTRMLSISDRGFGPLYVDDQPGNLRNYNMTVARIANELHVSRKACSIRLVELGLLTDERVKSRRG